MSEFGKDRGYIRRHITPRMAMVMMMEEAAEVVQACSKVLRCMDDDPCAATPVTMKQAQESVAEECADFLAVMDAAHMLPKGITTIHNPKWHRWAERAKEEAANGGSLASYGTGLEAEHENRPE